MHCTALEFTAPGGEDNSAGGSAGCGGRGGGDSEAGGVTKGCVCLVMVMCSLLFFLDGCGSGDGDDPGSNGGGGGIDGKSGVHSAGDGGGGNPMIKKGEERKVRKIKSIYLGDRKRKAVH